MNQYKDANKCQHSGQVIHLGSKHECAMFRIPKKLESKIIRNFNVSAMGLQDVPIPIEKQLKIEEHIYEVKQSTIPNAGYGLFLHSRVMPGTYLFPYNGPRYKYKTWSKLCTYLPRMKMYTIYEDPKVEPKKDRMMIVGDVNYGNIAGYINSSKKFNDKTNACWEYDPSLPPWKSKASSVDDYGYIATVCTVDMYPGDELFIEYDYEE